MGSSGKVLLVEDNPNDIELSIMSLAENGLTDEIVVARDGEKALDHLYGRGDYESREAGNPRVVLLDVKLPKMTGLEVLERIKTDPGLKTVPVVMFTSPREERNLLRSYIFGTNAYVVKPVSFQEFVEAVREVGLFLTSINEPPGNAERTCRPPCGLAREPERFGP